MSDTREELINCPREDCEGTVKVTLEYEPGESNWGADADGNRGIAVRGYWSGTAAETCTLGHTLNADEITDVEDDAALSAPDPEDEYYGPDKWDRDEDRD